MDLTESLATIQKCEEKMLELMEGVNFNKNHEIKPILKNILEVLDTSNKKMIPNTLKDNIWNFSVIKKNDKFLGTNTMIAQGRIVKLFDYEVVPMLLPILRTCRAALQMDFGVYTKIDEIQIQLFEDKKFADSDAGRAFRGYFFNLTPESERIIAWAVEIENKKHPLCGLGKFKCIGNVPKILQEIVDAILDTTDEDLQLAYLGFEPNSVKAESESNVNEIYKDQFEKIRIVSIEDARFLVIKISKDIGAKILPPKIPKLNKSKDTKINAQAQIEVARILLGMPDECTLTLMTLMKFWAAASNSVRTHDYHSQVARTLSTNLPETEETALSNFISILLDGINDPVFYSMMMISLSETSPAAGKPKHHIKLTTSWGK